MNARDDAVSSLLALGGVAYLWLDGMRMWWRVRQLERDVCAMSKRHEDNLREIARIMRGKK